MYHHGETAIRFAPQLSVDLPLRKRSGTVRRQLALSCRSDTCFLTRLADFRGALAVAQRSAALCRGCQASGRLRWCGFYAWHLFTIIWATKPRHNFTVSAPWLSRPSLAPRTLISSALIIASTLPSASPAPCGCAVSPIRRSEWRKAPSMKRLSGVLRSRYAFRWLTVRQFFFGAVICAAADDYVERLIEYAGRYSLEPYRAAGLGLKGELAIAREELEAGIDLLRGALETLTTVKLNLLLTDFMGALAEGLRKSGQLEEALLTINQSHRARNR